MFGPFSRHDGLPSSWQGRSEKELGRSSICIVIRALNKNVGLGQEITGVTLPADGTIKGWEFGQGVRLVCANVDDTFYALQGQCPRCGFDLYKGDLIAEDNAGWEDLPRVACPTCATTYSLQTGVHGPPIKRSGISNWVSGLAKTATQGDEYKDAKAFAITRDQDGRVYLREK